MKESAPPPKAKREAPEKAARRGPEAPRAGMPVGALPGAVAHRMRSSFGDGLDAVRLHTDTQAARIAHPHPAATVGRDVFFGSGRFRPHEPAGEILLAHELAHTLQQRGGPRVGAAQEAAADDAALNAFVGARARPQPSSGLGFAACSEYDVHAPENRARVDTLARLFRQQQRAIDGGASMQTLDRIDAELQRQFDTLPVEITGDPSRMRELRRRVLAASVAGAGPDASTVPEAEQALSLEETIRELQVQPHSDDELRRRVGEVVDAYRPRWQAQRSLQVTDDVTSESAWQRWRQARIFRAIGPAPAEPGPLRDMSDVEWVPSDDDGLMLVYGSAGIGIASARRCRLLRPATPAPSPPSPALVPAGPGGPTPSHARPAAPFVGVPGIGKEGLMLVHLGGGDGVLIDAGGTARVMPLDQVAALSQEMGIGTIRGIAITHPHLDHVRNLEALIMEHQIPPEQLKVAEPWRNHPRIRALFDGSNDALVELGYRPGRQVGSVAVPESGPMQGIIEVEGGHRIRYLADADAMREYRASPNGSRADAASLIYTMEAPQTGNSRVLVLQDVRGQNISALRNQLGEGAFGRALEGVRVIKGFGHHFGLSGGENAHVPGMNALVRTAMAQNGSLTIVVQTTEANSLVGGTSPLLEYARGLGARVVLVTDPGQLVLNDRMQIQVRGANVRDFRGNRTARLAAQRAAELNQAIHEVRTRGELGVRELGLSDRSPEEVLTALEGERTRIRRLHAELADRLGIRLANETRRQAGRAELGTRATENMLGDRPMPRPEAEIRTELGRADGPPLSDEVRRGLRRAAHLDSTLAVEAELGVTPRGLADTLRGSAEPEIVEGIEGRYRRLRELGGGGARDLAPQDRLTALAEVEGLIDALTQRRDQMPVADRTTLSEELSRLQDVKDSLAREVQTRTQHSRAADGTRQTTAWRSVEGSARVQAHRGQARDIVERGGRAAGRGLGAVMIVHSVHGLGDTASGLREGEVTLPQSALQVARDAAGIHMGIRLIRARHVGAGSLILYAALDIGAAALGEYETTEDRDIALYGAAINQGVNALCMLVGQGFIEFGVWAPTHPLVKAALIGFGAAVMFGGPLVLQLLGLDGYVVDWFSFPPAEVTRVQRRIRGLIDRYEAMIGARSLVHRDVDEIEALGAADGAQVRRDAMDTVTAERWRADELEGEIMGLFEAAYPEARTDWVGLRILDVEAARFARLRDLARGEGPGGRGSVAQVALQERFRVMQTGLNMTSMSAAEIRELPQWEKIDDRLDDGLLDALGAAAADVDYDALAEEVREMEWMIESARYRLEPASQGPYRTAPLLQPGPAREAYEAELGLRERRLAAVIARLTSMAGPGSFVEDETVTRPRTETAFAPRAVLLRLLRARDRLRGLVEQGRRAHPELAALSNWADPQQLAHAIRAAHAVRPRLFEQIRVAQMALSLASSQARFTLSRLPEEASDERHSFDEAIRQAAALAEERRLDAGLVLPSELEATLSAQTSLHHRELGIRYFSAPSDIPPLSPEELQALDSDLLADSGGRMNSPSRQLDAALHDPERQLTGDWVTILRLGPEIRVYEGGRIERREIHEANALVALTATEMVSWERSTIEVHRSRVAHVYPINAEAVRALGGRARVGILADNRALIPVRRSDLPSHAVPPSANAE